MRWILLALFATLPVRAQFFNLDRFDAGDFSFVGNTNFSQSLPTSQVLGGLRTVELSGDGDDAWSNVSLASGSLTFQRYLGNLTLTYGSYGQAGDSGSLHFNGTDYGVELLWRASGANPFTVSFSSSENGIVSYSEHVFSSGPDATVSRSRRLDQFNGNAEWSDIDGFRITLPAELNYPFAGSQWELINAHLLPITVPEPSTYAALFGVGLAGFAAWKRMRQS